MPPQRELNPRFQAHIRPARRIRIIGTTLAVACLVIGTGSAFAISPQGSGVQDAIKDSFASATDTFDAVVPAFSRAADTITNDISRLHTQVAAASSGTYVNGIADRVYRFFCPWFTDCWEPSVEFTTTTTPTPTQSPPRPIPQPTYTVATTTPQNTSAQRPANIGTGSAQPVQQTVINNPVVERVIERVVHGAPASLSVYVTQAELLSQIAAVKNSFGTQLYGDWYNNPSSSSNNGGIVGTIGMVGRVDNLSGTTITNPTITGGSITASSITGTISNAISSALATITDLTSTTITATNASTTNATTTTLYVGATTTTQNLRLASLDCSSLGNGGTLTTDAQGNVVCSADDGGSGSIGGADTQVQFNDGGSLGGDSGLTYNKTADRLTTVNASTTNFSASYASSTLLVAGTAQFGTITSGLWNGTAIGDSYITKSGDWTGTLDGLEGSFLLANSFATTSADYWKTQRDFFSTTSAQYFASTGLAFSTTSNDYWKSQNNFFATTSADYWKTQNNFFSTTSAQYFTSVTDLFSTTSANYFAHSSTTIPKTYTANTFTALQTFGNASTTNISATYASSTSGFFGNLSIGSLSGFLKATAGAISTALVDLASNVTGILPVANGGTGWASLASGAIPYGNGSSAVATTSAGTPGQVLALLNGVPTWTATTTLSNISGTLAAGSGGTGITNPSAAGILLGSYAGGSWQQLATSSLGLLTTNVAEGSNLYYTDSRVQSFVHSSTTIPKTYTSNTFTGSNIFNGTLTFGSLNGPLQANAGVVSATTSIGVPYGGTGQTLFTSSQLLYGNGAGSLLSVATSSASCSSGIACSSFSVVGSVSPSITFSAPASSALTIPFASSTAVSVSGTGYFGTASTTNFNLSGTANLQSLAVDSLLYNNSSRQLAAASVGSSLSFTGSSLSLNLGNGNTWTGLQQFYGAASSTLFSANWAKFGATASSTFGTDGTLTMGGNIILNGKYLSGDGGDEGVYVDTSGNVGIGTTAAQTKFHVAGNQGLLSRFETGNTGFSIYLDEGNATYTGSADTVTFNASRLGLGNLISLRFAAQDAIEFANDANTVRMFIDSSGNVGIGKTAVSGVILDANGVSRSTQIQMPNSAGTYTTNVAGFHLFGFSDNNLYFNWFDAGAIVFRNNGANERMRIDSSGNVGIGTTNPNDGKLEVKGGTVCVDTDSNDSATSCIANESDERLKTNIQAISASSSLDIINALNPVSFDWRATDPTVLAHWPALGRYAGNEHSIGLIAQQVMPVLPEALSLETVGDSEVQYYQLDYTKFIPHLIGAVKELWAKMQDLGQKIAALLQSDEAQNAKIQALEARVNALESQTGAAAAPFSPPPQEPQENDSTGSENTESPEVSSDEPAAEIEPPTENLGSEPAEAAGESEAESQSESAVEPEAIIDNSQPADVLASE